jgi:hypothetical protein
MKISTSFLFNIIFPFGDFLENVEKRSISNAILDLVLHILPLTFFIYWLFSLIPYGTLIYLTGFTFIASQRYIRSKDVITTREKLNIILWYFVIIICGVSILRNFIGHFFLSDAVADSIGWATGSQFQIELAFYHLGVSLAGLIAIWLRNNLVIGLAIIKIVFGLGAAYVHLKDIIFANNFSPGNTGSILLGDILIPGIFIALLILIYKEKQK